MYYLREVENICNTLWQIYSGQKYKILSESAWFVDDVREAFGVFRVCSSNCGSLTKRKC